MFKKLRPTTVDAESRPRPAIKYGECAAGPGEKVESGNMADTRSVYRPGAQ